MLLFDGIMGWDIIDFKWEGIAVWGGGGVVENRRNIVKRKQKGKLIILTYM